tara:strand:- start:442 stop:1386 length:945 start_codon:yes stop_codon:yes gene_type:complete
MRISENMMTSSILKSINASKSRMNTIQNQLSSGKKIFESSDDPFAFAKASRFKSIIDRNEQYLRSINIGLGFVEATQTHLEDINNLIQDAKEMATQAADDSLNAENREAMAQEINSMLIELESIANGKFDGDYLFNGTDVNLNSPNTPFTLVALDENGNGVIDDDEKNNFVSINSPSNIEAMERKFGDHLNIQINIAGLDIDKITDTFNKLFSLKEALNNNDTEGISEQIDELDSVSSEILKLTTKIGDVHSRITLTEQQLTLSNMNLSSYISSLEDVDMAEAVLKYNSEEMAYKAALQSTGNIMTTSLLDYIR